MGCWLCFPGDYLFFSYPEHPWDVLLPLQRKSFAWNSRLDLQHTSPAVSGCCQSLWKAMGLAVAIYLLQTRALGSNRLQHLAQIHGPAAFFFFSGKQRCVSLRTMTIRL